MVAKASQTEDVDDVMIRGEEARAWPRKAGIPHNRR